MTCGSPLRWDTCRRPSRDLRGGKIFQKYSEVFTGDTLRCSERWEFIQCPSPSPPPRATKEILHSSGKSRNKKRRCYKITPYFYGHLNPGGLVNEGAIPALHIDNLPPPQFLAARLKRYCFAYICHTRLRIRLQQSAIQSDSRWLTTWKLA